MSSPSFSTAVPQCEGHFSIQCLNKSAFSPKICSKDYFQLVSEYSVTSDRHKYNSSLIILFLSWVGLAECCPVFPRRKITPFLLTIAEHFRRNASFNR